MAGKSDTYEADLLKLYFNATNIANVADNTATAPATSIYVSLWTTTPTDAATGTEVSYTGYARVAVLRTSGGWAISGTSPTQASPVANIDFGQMTAGAGGTVVAFGVSRTIGQTTPDYFGAVSLTIGVVNGTIPRLTTASTITED